MIFDDFLVLVIFSRCTRSPVWIHCCRLNG